MRRRISWFTKSYDSALNGLHQILLLQSFSRPSLSFYAAEISYAWTTQCYSIVESIQCRDTVSLCCAGPNHDLGTSPSPLARTTPHHTTHGAITMSSHGHGGMAMVTVGGGDWSRSRSRSRSLQAVDSKVQGDAACAHDAPACPLNIMLSAR